MHSVVLDTSVVIAGLRSASGASFAVLEGVGRKFELNISVPLVLEYEAVTKRLARELGLTFEDIDDVLDYLCSVAHHRLIYYLWRPVLRDPKDDLVLELAVESNADYLVTHNIRDFAGSERFGVRVVSPRDVLGILRRSYEGETR
jgi:putative PIN family toxin of toxin-antitoxin system